MSEHPERAPRRRGATAPAPDAAAIASNHDYIWARLPYLVPMAAKIAKQCRLGDRHCADRAVLVAELRSILLDHLDREEHLLSSLVGEADPRLVAERISGLHAEHHAVAALLDRIRALASVDRHTGDDACNAERALRDELAAMDDHVRRQIVIEERVLATCLAPEATAGVPFIAAEHLPVSR